MNPRNVNPGNFSVASIAYTDVEEDMAYPKAFGNPMWFMLPQNIVKPFLKSIIGEKGTDNKNVIKVLEDLSVYLS